MNYLPRENSQDSDPGYHNLAPKFLTTVWYYISLLLNDQYHTLITSFPNLKKKEIEVYCENIIYIASQRTQESFQ